jgi:hypothetical protein
MVIKKSKVHSDKSIHVWIRAKIYNSMLVKRILTLDLS